MQGIPVGTKIARIGAVKEGETFIDIDGLVNKALSNGYCKGTVILEPDNAYRVIDLDSIPTPDGHRRVGFRETLDNEWYINSLTRKLNCDPYHAAIGFCTLDTRRIIVEPIPKPKKRVLVVEYVLEDIEHELEDSVDVANVIVSYKNASYLSYPAFRIEERD